ncbi:hypothetical protein [Actinophytocola glycyrrhizae]|uniref:Uncharacterized protein n=1 Tax=Actinophytocola glycyrrhizae TaxID=2044873 RepID=A0ABV9RXG8_9PSEU
MLTTPEGNVEVRETLRDEVVVWAYTRLALMVPSCGSGQPFVRVTARELRTVGKALDRFAYAAVDLRHPDGARYPEPDRRDDDHLPLIDTTVPDTSLLWVPIRPGSVGTAKAMVEMVAEGQDGLDGPLVLVYSTLARLRAELGARRAAASFRAEHLGRLTDDIGARSVVFDASVAEHNRKETSSWTTGTTRRR